VVEVSIRDTAGDEVVEDLEPRLPRGLLHLGVQLAGWQVIGGNMVCANSAAGQSNRARAPQGVSVTWMPCWRPWVRIRAGALCSPASRMLNGEPEVPSNHPQSSGSSNWKIRVKPNDGTPWWIASGARRQS